MLLRTVRLLAASSRIIGAAGVPDVPAPDGVSGVAAVSAEIHREDLVVAAAHFAASD